MNETTNYVRQDDTDEAARAAAQHARVLEGLEQLTDYLADAGPGSNILEPNATLSIIQGLREADYGPAPDRVRRLVELAAASGTKVTKNPSPDAAHYYASLDFADGAVTVRAYTIVAADDAEAADAALAEATAPIIREMWEAAVTPPPASPAEPALDVNYTFDHFSVGAEAVKAAFAEHGIRAHTPDTGTAGLADGTVEPRTDQAGVWGTRVTRLATNPDGLPEVIDRVTFPPFENYSTIGDYIGAIARYLKGEPAKDHDQPGCCNEVAGTAVRGIHADGRVRTVYASKAHVERVRLELASMGFVTVELTGRDHEFETWAEDLPVCGTVAEEVLGL